MTHMPFRLAALSCAGLVCLLSFRLDAAPSRRKAGPFQTETIPGGWLRHKDPSGTFIDTPPGWTVALDRSSGRISAAGPLGQRVHFWPGFIQDRSLNPASAQTVLALVVRKLDPALPWGNPGVQGSMARLEARTARCKGVALLSWRAADGGTALLAQAVEAPPALYQSNLDIFGRILGSYRSQPRTASPGPLAPPVARQISFVRWTDPREAAFSTEVPRGWEVVGGLYRLSATDVRSSLRLLSPDHQVLVFVNDARLGSFMQPSPVLAGYGFREGSVYPLSDGSQLQVRRYLAGQSFASEYATSMIQKDFANLRLISTANRPDLASNYRRELLADYSGQFGKLDFSITAGEASFTCNPKGMGSEGPWKGYVSAGTAATSTPQSSIWFIHCIYGYVASPARQADAERVLQRVTRAFATSAAWRQKQRQIAANAVQQDQIRSQKLRSQVLAKIAQDQRETSDLIVSSYNKRNRAMDEISRKRENAILGTVDVVDPTTRDRYKVSYDSDVHWMSDTGRIVGTSVGANPGPGWNQMLALP